MKKCRKCKQSKPLEDFSPRKGASDGRHSYCRDCQKAISKVIYHLNPEPKRQRVRMLREKILGIIQKIKSSKGCQFCSEREPVCLDFHHLDPTKKDGNVGAFVSSQGLEKALAEIEKCICVCSNCHRKIHAGIIGL